MESPTTSRHRRTDRCAPRCALAALLALLLCTVQAAMLLHDSGLHAGEEQCQLDPLTVHSGGQVAAVGAIGCAGGPAGATRLTAPALGAAPQLRARRPAARAPPASRRS